MSACPLVGTTVNQLFSLSWSTSFVGSAPREDKYPFVLWLLSLEKWPICSQPKRAMLCDLCPMSRSGTILQKPATLAGCWHSLELRNEKPALGCLLPVHSEQGDSLGTPVEHQGCKQTSFVPVNSPPSLKKIPLARTGAFPGSQEKSHYSRKEMRWHFLAANFESHIWNHSKSSAAGGKAATDLESGTRNTSKSGTSLGVILIVKRTDTICLDGFLFIHLFIWRCHCVCVCSVLRSCDIKLMQNKAENK